MEKIFHIDTVSYFDALYQKENLHPLVSVINYTDSYPEEYASKINFSFYTVFLKDTNCGDIRYGRSTYDYKDRTLLFLAPGQVMNATLAPGQMPQGYVLAFHADLIHGTSLGRHIDDYSFFSYQSTEALHISEKERRVVLDCFDKIKDELERGMDKHSRKLIASNIELFLDYCVRFYDRQFITRTELNKGALEQFERLMSDYFHSDKPQTIGLPAVSYFADQLHFSPNYFGDIIKKETGKSAHDYIQLKIMDIAKEKILNPSVNISEIAYELGFKYPAHFTRSFKKRVGVTPIEYRSLN
ncbi:helix-turn-helix transcriptional regulator [Pedobacter sp. N36a]|uniref:helix-turn-helix domain-containing protein n=1 Tax=Pedobacter sp. N36a TaxID=2767996 RepID=UPI001656AA22|nr:helix-turn-helix domain-containing protein [Pedobacter sp. N36a]MBC8987982.1 helix-turn-helix transcriptional regulator [Pedobacter sp. N36a]